MNNIVNWYLAIIISNIDKISSVYFTKRYKLQSLTKTNSYKNYKIINNYKQINKIENRYDDLIKYFLPVLSLIRSLLSLIVKTIIIFFKSIQLSQLCLQWSLLFWIVIILYPTTIVLARPQGCILCNRNDLKGSNPSLTTYEEFRFEHQVTRLEAIQALRRLNYTFYEGKFIINSKFILFENIIIILLYCN